MDIKDIIDELISLDIRIQIQEEELRIIGSKQNITSSIIEKIKLNKSLLIDYFHSNKITNNLRFRIPSADISSSYPLSSSQQRLWTLSQFRDVNVIYNVPNAFLFEGNLDLIAYEYSYRRILERHEILRTIFKEDERGNVRQIIIPYSQDIKGIELKDFFDEDNLLNEGEVHEMINAEMLRAFDLSSGPLIRSVLYRIEDRKWVFVYVMHHIISDAWSTGLLIRELVALYNAYKNEQQDPLLPLRIQYKDYAVWEQEQLKGAVLEDHKQYWLKHLEGELPVLDFPGDRPRPATKTYRGGIISRIINPETGKSLKTLSQSQGCTLFMGLLASVKALLYRYTGQEDIILGSSIANREHADLEDQIGFYVNTLALRTRFSGQDSFTELLERVKEVTLGAYEHQSYPFDDLVESIDLKRDMSRSTLFDVMVVLPSAAIESSATPQNLGDIKVSNYEVKGHAVSKFDFTFFFTESEERLELRLSYNRDIYDKETIERLTDHLECLIREVLLSPDRSISQIEYISDGERRELLEEFGMSSQTYPEDRTVVDLFEEQVLRTPQEIALVCEDRQISYRELNERSNRLAGYLREECGVKANDIVGLLLDRSEKMVIALLGVLKAGGAYVAIEPEYPQERKAFIVKDTGIKALITQSEYIFDLDYYDGHVFAIDIQLEGLPEPSPSPVTKSSVDDLAYVVYTSGSTGQPKGVMINHVSLLDYYYSIMSRTNMGSCKSFGLVSTLAADLGNTVLYPCLLTGGSLRIFSTAEVMNAGLMKDAIVDCLKIVPSHWKALQEKEELFAPAKCLIFGGEQLTDDVIERIRKGKGNCHVYNHYGPSETTIGKLIKRVDVYDLSTRLSLGTPFGNTEIYILSEDGLLQPVGVSGEICIGGKGLARGYLNRPELTEEKFVPNPYRPGERMYRTGDIGRWMADGNIEFLGRRDDQVKIRGYRIELGEIESVVQGYEGISSSVVVVRSNAEGDKELVCYVISSAELKEEELRLYLRDRLPQYMIPLYFVQLESLPLTANGKIDRNRLPAPHESSGVEYIAPRTEIEQKLSEIWSEVLGKERIGVRDDFFQLGGHSLKATRLASQLYKAFDVKVDFNGLFTHTVLEDQAIMIAETKRTQYKEISVAPVQESYPLSSSQHRLWVLSQFEESSVTYNVREIYEFEGELEKDTLEHALCTLQKRHEILRTIFKADATDDVRQYILQEDIPLDIPLIDLRLELRQEEKLKELLQNDFNLPFNLSHDRLIRPKLFQIENNKWIFCCTMHHIICDEWSMNVLIKELVHFYNSRIDRLKLDLKPLRIQYKDFALWQQQLLNDPSTLAHKEYWKNKFTGEVPLLDLTFQKGRRPIVKTHNVRRLTKAIPRELSNGLKATCQLHGCTLFMGLIAVVNTLLYKNSNQKDIVIGTPIAGREHPDLNDQIGFYINTLPLRIQFDEQDGFNDLLLAIRQLTLEAYEHQTYPFDELIKLLNLKRDKSRNVLFDVFVVLHNATEIDKQDTYLNKLTIKKYQGQYSVPGKFDLLFAFSETEDDLYANLEYNTDIVGLGSAEMLFEEINELLYSICKNAKLELSAIKKHLEQKEVKRNKQKLQTIRLKNLAILKNNKL
ncbi:MAG: amino acid adenylation domain-containing protein [Chitinophagaceae bacterium]|nr:amino acid adenylation domain-containing protein [Chitinophagaceae bacterium]